MSTTGPIPPADPIAIPPLKWTALRDEIKSLRKAISYMQKDRTATPLRLHNLLNTGAMWMAQPGHVAVQDPRHRRLRARPVAGDAVVQHDRRPHRGDKRSDALALQM